MLSANVRLEHPKEEKILSSSSFSVRQGYGDSEMMTYFLPKRQGVRNRKKSILADEGQKGQHMLR